MKPSGWVEDKRSVMFVCSKLESPSGKTGFFYQPSQNTTSPIDNLRNEAHASYTKLGSAVDLMASRSTAAVIQAG